MAIEVQNDRQLIAALKGLPRALRREVIHKSFDEIGQQFEVILKSTTEGPTGPATRSVPVYTGVLRNKTSSRRIGDRLVTGSDTSYAENLHFGLPPKQPINLGQLARWVRRVIKPPENAVFPIAVSLKKNLEAGGPRPRPYLTNLIEFAFGSINGPALKTIRNNVIEFIRSASGR